MEDMTTKSPNIAGVAALTDGLDHARSSDRHAGEQIAEQAEINFSTDQDLTVASVGSTAESGGRTVRFALGEHPVSWSCTCVGDDSPWCKHVVAAVLTADRRH